MVRIEINNRDFARSRYRIQRRCRTARRKLARLPIRLTVVPGSSRQAP